MMSDKPVHMEASLTKDVCKLWCTVCFDIYQIKKKFMCFFSHWWQIYYHGDPIPINIKVKNETNKVVKKIKITGEIDRKQFSVIHKLYV